MPSIHPTAVVSPRAELADDVEVGAFSLVGDGVRIGPGTRLKSHVSITGDTTIGARNVFFPFASIGAEPQDMSFRGEPSRTEIGDDNTFRESVTVSRGTAKDRLLTRIGSRNLVMACCHIAHDCELEDEIIMANNVLLGGHVRVEERVTFGGASVVHHFATIGRYAFVGGMTRIVRDVPPFMTIEGIPPKVWMVNKIGCERRGMAPAALAQLKEAHRLLFRTDVLWEDAFEELTAREDCAAEVRYLVEFCRKMSDGVKGRAKEKLRASGHGHGHGHDGDDED
ncbi:MAG TPA: acyl-ACP--UDP-N-acetylglucosamine O-acyltransferase [Planctomycetota bacterium]|nr:acyl-ACP--UDP-N-acetylglucosamine O-acyltransferase [Planctomycetota bacterium]